MSSWIRFEPDLEVFKKRFDDPLYRFPSAADLTPLSTEVMQVRKRDMAKARKRAWNARRTVKKEVPA